MERYLLDTMSLLWMTFLPEKIPTKSAETLCDSEADLSYTVASLWEIGLKMAKGGYDEFHLPDDWGRRYPGSLKNSRIAGWKSIPKNAA